MESKEEREEGREEKVEKKEESREELIERIRGKMEKNSKCSELLISLFSAAVKNYRRSSICSPFPQFLKDKKEPNFKDAVSEHSLEKFAFFFL